jgi:VanZ family protein
MSHNIKIITWIPAILIMIIIFGFSASNGEQSSGLSLELTKDIVGLVTDITNTDINQDEELKIIEMIHTPIRKLGHLTEYAALGFALCIPFYFYHGKRKRNLYVYSEIVLVIYAGIDELHQLFVAERSGRFTDVLIDGLGGLIGIFVFCIILRLASVIVTKVQKGSL